MNRPDVPWLVCLQRFERLADHIRVIRPKLLHQEYGYSIDGQFTKKTRSFPMLARMKDVWAAGTAPTEDEFIGEVIGLLLEGRTGNLYDAHLEHDIAMLIPSLIAQGPAVQMPANSGSSHRQTDSVDSEQRISVALRLQLELAGRTTDEISSDDAPPAIWVPQNAADAQRLERTSSYEQMQDRLAKGRAAIEAARAAAAQNPAGVSETARPDRSAPDPKSKRSLYAISKNLTKLLRHNAELAGLVIRPHGHTPGLFILAGHFT